MAGPPVVSAGPLQRVLAWLPDWLGVLVWLALIAAIGVPLYLSGLRLDPYRLNLIATLAAVVPVVVALAWFESGRRQATPGKRWRKLRVVRLRDGRRISRGQGLVRNFAKVGLPWTLGHVVATAAVFGETGRWFWVLAGLTYALAIGYLVTLFVGSHRTPYDRLAGTRVVREA